jgi:transcriptional regulator with XRE-family HTH domain
MKTPKEIQTGIASHVRIRRRERKLSMNQLADRSGVSYGSIKRFERTGAISLTALLKIAIVLDCADEFEYLFTRQAIHSIQEIIDGTV